jgi:hypothetical protein
MKYFKLLTLLIAPMLILSACKKSNNTPPAPAPGMSFKVNGTLDKTEIQGATFIGALKQLNASAIYNNRISYINFTIGGAQVGTYDVAKDHVSVMLVDNGATYKATSGTFTITALSTTSVTGTSVTGTFQFSASDVSTGATVNITEGEFNIPLSNTSSSE